MVNEKKCPHCNNWSEWNSSLDDVCEHCGELLQKKEKEKAIKKKLLTELQEKKFLFHVKKEDHFLKKVAKKGGYAIYLLAMAVASFLSWLLFWLGP